MYDNSIEFDATQIAPSTGVPEPLPVGVYPVQVTAIEKKPTNDGQGWRVAATYTVLEGPYQGRQIFEGFNLGNKNPQTVEIAQKDFSALCHVTGVLSPRNLDEFKNKPFQVKLRIAPAKDGYDASNKVSQYLKIDGTKLGGGVAGTIAPTPARPSASSAPAWAKKAS